MKMSDKKRIVKSVAILIVLLVTSGCVQITHHVQKNVNETFKITSTYMISKESDIPAEQIQNELKMMAENLGYRYRLIETENAIGIEMSKEYNRMRQLNEELPKIGIERVEYDALFNEFSVRPERYFTETKDFIDKLSSRMIRVNVQIVDENSNIILSKQYVLNLKGSGLSHWYVPRWVSYSAIATISIVLIGFGCLAFFILRRVRRYRVIKEIDEEQDEDTE